MTYAIMACVNTLCYNLRAMTSRKRHATLNNFLNGSDCVAHFECGDSLEILRNLPDQCIDCVITSPPYWQQREYDHNGGSKFVPLGDEADPNDYVANLVEIFEEMRRVIKNKGSLWLNLGDKYHEKNLMGMPWRVAIAMQDKGWILRNDIIWDQMKGTQSAKDRLRNVHEYIFHFVKNKIYYYAADKIRIKPAKRAQNKNGVMISASGVSGKKYYKQISESTVLTELQQARAKRALDDAIGEMKDGKIVDFRMTIKGNQRTFHSDSKKISGRAKELEQRGFYILKMRATGFLPSTIWRIVPEDKWRKDTHCAVFPEELLVNPIKATCPRNGIVLDPFSGSGSTVLCAANLGRRGLGLEISECYHNSAKKRFDNEFQKTLSLLPLD